MEAEPTNRGFAGHLSRYFNLLIINELTLSSRLLGPGLGPMSAGGIANAHGRSACAQENKGPSKGIGIRRTVFRGPLVRFPKIPHSNVRRRIGAKPVT